MVHINVSFVGFTGPIKDLVHMVRKLERMGVDSVSFPDDLYLRDPFPALANLALNSERIELSFITNPYSRHPVLIARAVATLLEMAPDRISLWMSAGGSFTLKPLNIPMWDRPVTRVREALQICRTLLSGKNLNFNGQIFKVHDVKLHFPFPHNPPKIFVVGRGPQILRLTGELGDGALINPISLAYEKMVINEICEEARRHNRDPEKLILGTSVTFTQLPPEEFLKRAVRRIVNVIHDTPLSLIQTYHKNVTPEVMETLKKIHDAPSIDAAVPLVTEEIANLYPDTVNSEGKLIELLRERTRRGYKSVGLVAAPGEEEAFMKSLSEGLIDELHAIRSLGLGEREAP
ncbi:MAG TPA: LLM class flavin-dependent oxidoreductase [Candidatus Bathyarchaeia archaeon]|nr:LLM class flavin-dependent oxidoreductase [Candidatus Bathyarchaeia archaeon]